MANRARALRLILVIGPPVDAFATVYAVPFSSADRLAKLVRFVRVESETVSPRITQLNWHTYVQYVARRLQLT